MNTKVLKDIRLKDLLGPQEIKKDGLDKNSVVFQKGLVIETVLCKDGTAKLYSQKYKRQYYVDQAWVWPIND